MSRVRLTWARPAAWSPRGRRASHGGSRRGVGLLALVVALTGVLAPGADAAVSFRDRTCGLVTSTTSIVLPKPAGTVAGDVLVANVGFASTTASSGPAGWTKIPALDGTVASSHRLTAWYRVAGASEPASYTFSVTGATDVIGGGVTAFSGVDPDAPIADAAQWAGGSSGNLFTLPNATATAAGSMRLSAVAMDDTSASTYSGGMIELCDQESSVGADLGQSSAYEATGAGVTATRTVALDEDLNGVLHTLVLHPAPPPSVSAVTPTAGPTAGGTAVTITGANFTGATSVTFGGTAASAVTVVNATTITATAPARAAGTVDVVVATPAGTSANTVADDYTYVAAPAVTNLSPAAGPTAGGTAVTITGTNLSGASAVSFGGTPATSFTVDSPTQITATAPYDVAVSVTGCGPEVERTAAITLADGLTGTPQNQGPREVPKPDGIPVWAMGVMAFVGLLGGFLLARRRPRSRREPEPQAPPTLT